MNSIWSLLGTEPGPSSVPVQSSIIEGPHSGFTARVAAASSGFNSGSNGVGIGPGSTGEVSSTLRGNTSNMYTVREDGFSSGGSNKANGNYQCCECELYSAGWGSRCVSCGSVFCPKCAQYHLQARQSAESSSSQPSQRTYVCLPCLSESEVQDIDNPSRSIKEPNDFIFSINLNLLCSREALKCLLVRSLGAAELDSVSHLIVKCGRDIGGFNVLSTREMEIDIKLSVDIRMCEANSFPVKVNDFESCVCSFGELLL
jgi:hypothetical protein